VSRDRPVRTPRDPARSPHASAGSTCFGDRLEEPVREPSALAAEEVRRCSATADELDVHVCLARGDVAQQPSVAVDVVEAGVALELDSRAPWHQPPQLRECGARVALVLAELRRVDLDEPDAFSASQIERVSVPDAGDNCARGPLVAPGARATDADCGCREDERKR
jgi:hypothetical protein